VAVVFQSSYDQEPADGYLGQPHRIERARVRIMRGFGKAGYGMFLVPAAAAAAGVGSREDCGEVSHQASPAVAVDVDAIVAAFTTSAALQTLSGAGLTGAVGGAQMWPGRLLTATLSSHADWNATTMTITGINEATGRRETEDVAIPDGGNATITSTKYWSSIESIAIPAQAGTGGTATFGIAAVGSLTINHFAGVAARQHIKTTLATADLYRLAGSPTTSTTAAYIDNEPVPCVEDGDIEVFTEEATTETEPVYVRVASGSGGSVLGAFRNDSDSSTCVLVQGARFLKSRAAGRGYLRLPTLGNPA
jgi:hypothetical protein